MGIVICFSREPFFTYYGFTAIGITSCLLCGSLLCLRFRVGRHDWLRMLVVVLLGFAAAVVMMSVLSIIAQAIYQFSIGEPRGLIWLMEHVGADAWARNPKTTVSVCTQWALEDSSKD